MKKTKANEGRVVIGTDEHVFMSSIVHEGLLIGRLKPLIQIPTLKRPELSDLFGEDLLILTIPANISTIDANTIVGVVTDAGGHPVGIKAEYLNLESEEGVEKCTTKYLLYELNKRLIIERELQKAA